MHAEQAYLFRHALLRDAAYQLQLPGARSRLHALAACVLEEIYGQMPQAQSGGVVEELVQHAALAEEHLPANLVARLPQFQLNAALHCMRSYRNNQARLWFEQADSHPNASAVIRLEARLWAAQYKLGQSREAAERMLQSCLPLFGEAHSPLLEGRCHLGLAILSEHRVPHAQTEAHYENALAALRGEKPSPELANALSCLAVWRFEIGRHEDADSIIDNAQAVAELTGQPGAIGRVMDHRANMLYRRGRLREVVAVALHAMELTREDGRIQAQCAMRAANAYSDQGSVEEADQFFDVAAAGFERAGSHSGLLACRTDRARHLQNSGRWAQAEAEYLAIERLAREGEHRATLDSLDQNRASLAFDRGQWQAALERYQRAEENYRKHGNMRMTQLCRGGAAMARAELGGRAEAIETLVAVCAGLERMDDKATLSGFELALGMLLMDNQDFEGARRRIERAISLGTSANREGARVRARAALASLLAMQGLVDEAGQALAQAQREAEQCQSPSLKLEVDLDAAKIALLRRERDGAQQCLESARLLAGSTAASFSLRWQLLSLSLRAAVADGGKRSVLESSLARCEAELRAAEQGPNTLAASELARLRELVSIALDGSPQQREGIATGFLPQERLGR